MIFIGSRLLRCHNPRISISGCMHPGHAPRIPFPASNCTGLTLPRCTSTVSLARNSGSNWWGSVRSSRPVINFTGRKSMSSFQRWDRGGSRFFTGRNVVFGLLGTHLAVFCAWKLAEDDHNYSLRRIMQTHFRVHTHDLQNGHIYTLLTSTFSHNH
jgi:hypothetical protein